MKCHIPYKLEFPIHFHPEVEITENEAFYLAGNKEVNQKMNIQTDTKIKYEVISGQEDPLLGWYSDRFNRIEPAKVLYGTNMFNGNQKFTTIISLI